MLRRDAGDLGDDFLDVGLADGLLLLRFWQDALGGTGFVDHVDGLVRQMAVRDVAGRQLDGGRNCRCRVLDAVVRFEACLQALENLDGFSHRGFIDIDLLEAPRQRAVLFEDAAELGVGGRADALHLAGGECRLEQIRGIQRTARGRAGADQRVDFVNEQDGMRVILQCLENTLQALFEIATILGAGEQGAHIERIDIRLGENFRHVALDDLARQALGDGGLADTGFANQQRVVLAATAERLDDAFEFLVTPDQRVDLALQRQRVEVDGVLLERPGFGLFAFGFRLGFRLRFGLRYLADAV